MTLLVSHSSSLPAATSTQLFAHPASSPCEGLWLDQRLAVTRCRSYSVKLAYQWRGHSFHLGSSPGQYGSQSPIQREFANSEVDTLARLAAISQIANYRRCLTQSFHLATVVRKKGVRRFRLVIDMSKLTDPLFSPKFKLNTVEQFLMSIQPGWKIWTVDLRDAHFHMLIAPTFWKLR